MCFLNLMTYDVLEGYNLSLQKTVVDLENATEADATALAEEANYLLERIDVKIRGTYVFDIVLIVISFIVTIVAIVISLRMIAKPLKQVSQTLNESKSVGKIQELTTGILEIARQTNLLALMKMGEKANIAIVDSISMLSQLSEEVSAGTASSKETLNGTMEKI